MLKSSLVSVISTVALVATLALGACGKAPPKSTTTTRVETTTTDDNGHSTATDVKTTDTMHPDGSKTTDRTENSTKTTPAPGH